MVLVGESGAEKFTHALVDHKADSSITAANLLESMMVIETRTEAVAEMTQPTPRHDMGDDVA